MTHIVVKSGSNKTYFNLGETTASSGEKSNTKAAFIEYRAATFKTENAIAKVNYSVKGVRAVFDPDLGPSGGYRCPRGTQYGGYITDRFGRGCGGGIIRRVGRALANTGMRLENFADRRDDRRRNRAVQRRMKPNQKPGQRRERIARAMERGARRLVDAYPVDNLGPNSGGRPQRRNIPAPPKKRTAVVKPKPKPKRVVKPQAEKKPARPQGKAPVKPKVPKKPSTPKQPTRKPSERNQGSSRAPKTTARELVSSGPRANSKRKLAHIIFDGFQDDQKRKAGLDALIESIEKTIAKRMDKLPPDISKLSGRERMLAERDLEDVRIWMSELNAAKQMRKHLDSGIGTSQISARLRNRIDRENREISEMSADKVRNRAEEQLEEARAAARREAAAEAARREALRDRSVPGLDTLLDEEEAIAQAQARARAEAAQRVRDRREAARSARSQVSRPPSKLTVSEPVQRPRQTRKPNSFGAAIPELRVEERAPQKLKPFAPIPSVPGELPVPKGIVNPKLNTLPKAKAHFDNGGDLAEVPQRFWHAVLNANAAQPQGARRVKKIAPNGGAIKQVEIFTLEDQTQGWVFNRVRGQPNEAMREVMAQNIMVALGLDAAPARMDGKDGAGKQDLWAVMPFAWNFAPPGKPVGNGGGANYILANLQQLEDRAAKERLGGLLFNYALGIPDRHNQNGMADVFVDDNGVKRPFVMPIDMGWFGRGRDDLVNYANEYWMDNRLPDELNRLVQGRLAARNLSRDERVQLHEDLKKVYDGFLVRIQRLTDNPNFVNDIIEGYNIDDYAARLNWDPFQKDSYERRVRESAEKALERLKKTRESLENNRLVFIDRFLGGDQVA